MSQRFLQLESGGREAVVDAYFSSSRVAEQHRPVETRSAVLIQSHWRMYATRQWFLHRRNCCIEIQRVIRGALGRMRFCRVRMEHRKKVLHKYFCDCATTIQRAWRGYFSRTYVHNFYERQQYLREVTKISERVREEGTRRYRREMERAEEDRDRQERKDFSELAENLHHLVSTATISGVYNPPFSLSGPPRAYGETVEDHLRRTAQQKHNAVTTTTTAEVLSRSTRQSTVVLPPLLNESVRSEVSQSMRTKSGAANFVHEYVSEPYDTHLEKERQERRVAKAMQVAGDWNHTGKRNAPLVSQPPPSSVHVGAGYVDKQPPLRGSGTASTGVRTGGFGTNSAPWRISNRDPTRNTFFGSQTYTFRNRIG